MRLLGARAWAAVALSFLGCGGSSAQSMDAASETNVAVGKDAATDDAAVGTDAAADGDGPAGFFIAGDLAGMTWVAANNIGPLMGDWLFVEATVEPSTEVPQWYFNFHLPPGPFPYTLQCDGNYIEFRETGLDATARKYVSRSSTGSCSVTFVQPAEAGTLEGTFTANLRLSGTMMDFAVTNGRFRLPAAPKPMP